MYIIYSTSHTEEPIFYGTARTIWSAEAIVDELIDECYDKYLPKAIKHAEDWLLDLSEWEHCDFAPHDIVVWSKRAGEVFYDEMDDFLKDIDYYTYGESIAWYINQLMPNFKIGKTEDMKKFTRSV